MTFFTIRSSPYSSDNFALKGTLFFIISPHFLCSLHSKFAPPLQYNLPIFILLIWSTGFKLEAKVEIKGKNGMGRVGALVHILLLPQSDIRL